MSVLRDIIDDAVAAVVAEHPKYFTPKGLEKARPMIVRKILAAFSDRGDRVAEEQLAPAADTAFVFAEPKSREARSYRTLRQIAGAVPPKSLADGRIAIMRSAYCDSVFALADLQTIDCWPFLTDVRQIEAWREFFRTVLPDVPLRSIVKNWDGVSGIMMPGYWPPSKDGRMYDTSEPAA